MQLNKQSLSPAPEQPQHHQVSQAVAEQATHGHGLVPRNQVHQDERTTQSLHGSESLELDLDDSLNFTRTTIPQLDGNSSQISQNESRHSYSTTVQSKCKACLKVLETKEEFQWNQ